MIIGIHPDQIGEESYSKKWTEFLEARGVTVRKLNLLAFDALDQASQCDGIMWRWAHNPQDKQSAQRILYVIEHYLNIPVFPDSRTSWHYDEKIAQFYLLQAIEAPMPKTWLFWNQNLAIDWARHATYPVVFKLSVGASSSNVLKVNDEKEAIDLIGRSFRHGIFPMTMNEYEKTMQFPDSLSQVKQMLSRLKGAIRYVWASEYPKLPYFWWKPEHGYVYFQEFIPDNSFDTRITVIGDRVFGFRRLNRFEDFRASGSGYIDYNPNQIDERCVEIAFYLSERGSFQSMAYDFLYRDREPVVCEISYAYADWAVHNCPGHWQRSMDWVDGNMWPEEAQVEDFLNRIRDNSSMKAL